MKLVIQDAPALKAAVDAIVCLVEEGQFEIKADGIQLKAMDPSQISMVSFTMPKAAFVEYNVPEEMKLGLDIGQLSNVLSRGKKGENGDVKAEFEAGSPEITEMKSTTAAKATFPLQYLEDMVKATSSSSIVTVNLETDRPLKLEYEIEGAKVVYFLAPRIETE